MLLAAAGVLGFVAHFLKQPLIVAFIAVGILVGPAGLKWVSIGSEIDLLAKTGIALFYVAVALTFSSTIIIVKLLSDKREIDSLHGRIAIGFLIVQDLVVVLVMIALTAFGASTGVHWGQGIMLVVVKGIGLLVAVGLLMRYVLPKLYHQAARSAELLTTLSIGWGTVNEQASWPD